MYDENLFLNKENQVKIMEYIEDIFSLKLIISLNQKEYIDFFNKFYISVNKLDKMYKNNIIDFNKEHDIFIAQKEDTIFDLYDIDNLFIKTIKNKDGYHKLIHELSLIYIEEEINLLNVEDKMKSIDKNKLLQRKMNLKSLIDNDVVLSLKYNNLNINKKIKNELNNDKIVMLLDFNLIWNHSNKATDVLYELLDYILQKNINLLLFNLELDTEEDT